MAKTKAHSIREYVLSKDIHYYLDRQGSCTRTPVPMCNRGAYAAKYGRPVLQYSTVPTEGSTRPPMSPMYFRHGHTVARTQSCGHTRAFCGRPPVMPSCGHHVGHGRCCQHFRLPQLLPLALTLILPHSVISTIHQDRVAYNCNVLPRRFPWPSSRVSRPPAWRHDALCHRLWPWHSRTRLSRGIRGMWTPRSLRHSCPSYFDEQTVRLALAV